MENCDWFVFFSQSQNTTSLESGKFVESRNDPIAIAPVYDGIVNNTHVIAQLSPTDVVACWRDECK